jgi:transposase-like protein
VSHPFHLVARPREGCSSCSARIASRQYTAEFKVEAVRPACSIGGNAAAKRLGIPQSTITTWVRRGKAGTLDEADTAPTKRPVSELWARMPDRAGSWPAPSLISFGSQMGGGVSREGFAVRTAGGIERHRDPFSLTRMCRLAEVSRSGNCRWRARAPSQPAMSNAALDAQVATIHAASRRSRSRNPIARGLRVQGLAVGR